MELRDYQKDILERVEVEFSSGNKEVVIAASPSSGKTVMAMEFIKRHPTSKFLILTHGTNVLKNQWAKELFNNKIEASTVPGESRVTYGLPQGKRQLAKLGKIDYLIVDEAHEFTFAKTVQNLTKVLNPDKIIYLTGTPSKFVLRGLKPLVVPAIDLIRDGHVSDLYLGMVSTNAKLDYKDYNREGDVKGKSTKKIENTVDSDLDELLKSMHNRLCETGAFKSSPELRKLVQWGPTLGKLHKTMIACQSVKQAKKVEKYFLKNGISVISSNYENDVGSDNIQAFIDDPALKVLVVVDRGILGFNMPDLVNVVDLTCSKNIDRTYQLFARVMRKNDKYPDKYFFKFADEEHMLLAKFYMNASLMLMFPDFISKYNGKNLNACEVIVHRPVEPRERNEDGDKKEAVQKLSPTGVNVEPVFYETVKAGALLIDIFNRIGDRTNEYAYVTFGEIQKRIFGNVTHSPESKKTEIKKFYSINGYLPKRSSRDKNESDLSSALRMYCVINHVSYDPDFDLWARSVGYGENSSHKTKSEIKEFYSENGILPSSKNNKRLYQLLQAYCAKTNGAFDSDFNSWCRERGYGIDSVSKNKQDIEKFYKTKKRFPKHRAAVSEEARLATACGNYCNEKNNLFDLDFSSWCKQRGYKKDTVKDNIEKIKAFFVKENRFPAKSSKDPLESKLSVLLTTYCNDKRSVFDEDFNSWCRERGYGSGTKTPILCLETKETFVSQADASRKMGLPRIAITKHLLGLLKNVEGYTFHYVVE